MILFLLFTVERGVTVDDRHSVTVRTSMIVSNGEQTLDYVWCVAVHLEGERWAVAFRAVVIVGGQNFLYFLWRTLLHDHRTVVVEEARGAVVYVADLFWKENRLNKRSDQKTAA